MTGYINTQFRAVVRHDDSASLLVAEAGTRADAAAAAEALRVQLQAWLDLEYTPEVLRQRREFAQERGEDVAAVSLEPPLAKVEIECTRYQVGDDDIGDDPVAQAIVEAVIGTPYVRWPKSRDGDRAGRPLRLLFADHPTRDHWTPIALADSELMLQWFSSHGLEYPEAARHARKLARQHEVDRAREACQQQYHMDGHVPLHTARETVERLERELAAARQVLATAERVEARARVLRDENIQYHADTMARRVQV